MTLFLDGEDDLSIASSIVFSGCGFSRAIPGIWTREEFDPWSDLLSSSTWFLLYAGEFNPLSGV